MKLLWMMLLLFLLTVVPTLAKYDKELEDARVRYLIEKCVSQCQTSRRRNQDPKRPESDCPAFCDENIHEYEENMRKDYEKCVLKCQNEGKSTSYCEQDCEHWHQHLHSIFDQLALV